MDAKLDASMPVCFRAMLQRIEVRANAIMAKTVRAATLAIYMGFAVAVGCLPVR